MHQKHLWVRSSDGEDGKLATVVVLNVSLVMAVIGRLKAFLPVMQEANEKLFSGIEEKGREEFDIEVVDEDDTKPQILMVNYLLPSIILLRFSIWVHLYFSVQSSLILLKHSLLFDCLLLVSFH